MCGGVPRPVAPAGHLSLVVSLAGAALSWLVVNLPMTIMNFEAWEHFVIFHRAPRRGTLLLLVHLQRDGLYGAGDARVGAITVLAQTCLNGGGHALLEDELHCLGCFIRRSTGRHRAD